MTALIAGWAMQGAALVLLFARVGRGWYRHLGAFFILLAVTFHGVGEALYRLFPEKNTYRLYISQADQVTYFFAVSFAIFVLAVAYVAALTKPKKTHPLDVEELRAYFDWRILAVLTAPLVAFTFAGTDRIAFDQYDAQQQTLNSGLTGQFLLIGLTMTSVAVVLRFGPRLLIPALVVQALILASVGQRTGVVVGIAMLLYASSRIGVRLSRRAGVTIGVLAMLTLLVMTASRETTGREVFAAGETAGGRFQSLAAGASNIFSEETREGLELTASYRLDGNAFPSLQLAQINAGREGMGFKPIGNNARLAVPSALDPTKLDLPLEVRSEKYFAQVQLGMPYRDSLYTQLGGTVGYFGVSGLIAAAAIMGLLFGRLDTALLAGPTPKRLLIGVGALNAIAYYSASLDHWFVNARGILLLIVILWGAQVVRRTRLATGKRPARADSAGSPVSV